MNKKFVSQTLVSDYLVKTYKQFENKTNNHLFP